MNAHVWTKMAMASALMIWGMTAQAQTSSSGGVPAGQGVAAPQTRPAPVSGKVGTDPAAVALRPAAQAAGMSKATQVAPPANPNEPLFSPAAETPARAAAVVSTTATPKATEPVIQQRKPHVDRTEGVKKPSKTAPQARDKKVQGKPLHARKGAATSNKDAGQNDSTGKDAHKGKKKADKSAAVHQIGKGKQVTPSAPSTKKHSEQAAAGKHAASPKVQAKAASSQRGSHASTAVAASTGKGGAKHPRAARATGATTHTASVAHQAAHTATAKSAHKKAAAHAAAKSTVAAKASAPAGRKTAHKNANKAARSAHKPA